MYYSANALARNMTRMAEKEFERTGLAPSLGFVVMTVNKKPGIAAGDIAHIMQLQASTVTRLVDKLVKSGYLKRKTAGKFVLVVPTPKATRLNERLVVAWQELFKRYTAILGEEPSNDLTAAMYEASCRLESGPKTKRDISQRSR
jgi:DNA-binding MarR family transcriptional regulator